MRRNTGQDRGQASSQSSRRGGSPPGGGARVPGGGVTARVFHRPSTIACTGWCMSTCICKCIATLEQKTKPHTGRNPTHRLCYSKRGKNLAAN